MAEQIALIDGETHVKEIADGYKTRLAAVKERYDAYHPDCQRRFASESHQDAMRWVTGCRRYLAGDYDTTYAGPHPSWPGKTLEDWRLHYGNDCLRSALHFVVWGEYYAGLRDRDSAVALDPWNEKRGS